MTEKWKPFPDDPQFQVSDRGRVKGITGRLLKQRDTWGNRYRVTIGKKPRYVHQLVLETFVGPRPDGQVARHLNDDEWDNRLSNLAWGTPSENQLDSVRNKTHYLSQRTHCPLGHELSGPNLLMNGHLRSCRSCQYANRDISMAKRRKGVDISHERGFRANRAYERFMKNVG